MTIHPFTEQEAQEFQRRSRGNAVDSASVQIDMLRTKFKKRGEVDHGLFQRLVQSVLKIGAHIGLTPERTHELEKKIEKAGTGDNFTVYVDGSRVYIEGYFDLNKLRQEILW